ncbi:MAG: hypothetical protein H2069_04945 [Legionella sp.]|nr:hypothetical protein [Legionella sp.]
MPLEKLLFNNLKKDYEKCIDADNTLHILLHIGFNKTYTDAIVEVLKKRPIKTLVISKGTTNELVNARLEELMVGAQNDAVQLEKICFDKVKLFSTDLKISLDMLQETQVKTLSFNNVPSISKILMPLEFTKNSPIEAIEFNCSDMRSEDINSIGDHLISSAVTKLTIAECYFLTQSFDSLLAQIERLNLSSLKLSHIGFLEDKIWEFRHYEQLMSVESLDLTNHRLDPRALLKALLMDGSKTKTLSLNKCGITEQMFEILCLPFQAQDQYPEEAHIDGKTLFDTPVEVLNLADNQLGDRSLQRFVDLMVKIQKKRVEALEAYKNQHPNALPGDGPSLNKQHKIKEIGFRSNNLTDESILYLSQHIYSQLLPATWDLRNNKFSQEGTDALADAIRPGTVNTTLDIRLDPASDSVNKALANNRKLHEDIKKLLRMVNVYIWADIKEALKSDKKPPIHKYMQLINFIVGDAEKMPHYLKQRLTADIERMYVLALEFYQTMQILPPANLAVELAQKVEEGLKLTSSKVANDIDPQHDIKKQSSPESIIPTQKRAEKPATESKKIADNSAPAESRPQKSHGRLFDQANKQATAGFSRHVKQQSQQNNNENDKKKGSKKDRDNNCDVKCNIF